MADDVCSFDRQNAKKIDWTALQATFLTDESELDVLMIIDCCKAAGAIVHPRPSLTGNIVFVLAASGFDNDTPLHGDTSYTANLIAELRDQHDKALEVTHFASLLLSRLSRIELPSGQKGVSSNSYILRTDEGRALRISRQPRFVEWKYWITIDRSTSLSSPTTVLQPQFTVLESSTDQKTCAEGDKTQPTAVRGTTEIKNHQLIKTNALAMIADPSPLPGWLTIGRPRVPTSAASDLLNDLYFDQMFESGARGHKSATRNQDLGRLTEYGAFHQWMTSDTKGAFWISRHTRNSIAATMSVLASSEQMQQYNPVTFMHSLSWRGLSGLYRSLLFQLLRVRPDQIANSKTLVGHGKVTSLAESRLESIWLTILGLTRDLPLCILVDIDSLKGNRDDVLPIVRQMKVISTMDNVKVCLLSVPRTCICETLANVPTLWLAEDGTSFDNKVAVGADLAEIATAFESSGGYSWSNIVVSDSARAHFGNQCTHIYYNSPLSSSSREYFKDHHVYAQGGSFSSSYGSRVTMEAHSVPDSLPTGSYHVKRILRILHASETMFIDNASVVVQPVITKVALHFALQQSEIPSIVMDSDMRAMEEKELQDINRSIEYLLKWLSGDIVGCENFDPDSPLYGPPMALDPAIKRFLERHIDFLESDWLAGDELYDDSSFVLLGSGILQLKRLPNDDLPVDDVQGLGWWNIVEQSLICAKGVEFTDSEPLQEYMSELDRTVTLLLTRSLPTKLRIVTGHASYP